MKTCMILQHTPQWTCSSAYIWHTKTETNGRNTPHLFTYCLSGCLKRNPASWAHLLTPNINAQPSQFFFWRTGWHRLRVFQRGSSEFYHLWLIWCLAECSDCSFWCESAKKVWPLIDVAVVWSGWIESLCSQWMRLKSFIEIYYWDVQFVAVLNHSCTTLACGSSVSVYTSERSHSVLLCSRKRLVISGTGVLHL